MVSDLQISMSASLPPGGSEAHSERDRMFTEFMDVIVREKHTFWLKLGDKFNSNIRNAFINYILINGFIDYNNPVLNSKVLVL